jgi:REP element-mobilizing transposase RayT
MPQSLSCLLIHLVFSTKNRERWIDEKIEPELYLYMSSIFSDVDSPSLAIGGTVDHVHVLCSLSRTQTVAHVIEKVKTGSSKWIKTKGVEYRSFAWQRGYGAFSIGVSNQGALLRYISNQKHRHSKQSFQDELRELFKRYNVSFDEHYVWD